MYDMFTHESERARGYCNFSYLFENKDFSRHGTYTVNVVMSQKRCQMESLLLYGPLIGSDMAYREATPMTFKVIHLLQVFSNVMCRTLCCS